LADSVASWPNRTPFVLFDELVRVYGTCVLEWAGVHVERGEAAIVAERLALIVDGFGFAPIAYPRACWARWWADRWARRVVTEARNSGRPADPGTMLEALVTGPGASLPAEVAAVELLNVLRPTVAVAWLGVFAAIELVRAPGRGSVLADPVAREARWHFADEVRRTAPFVPALAGRAQRVVPWRDHRIEAGDMVVLDVPGTNRRTWEDPDRFRPERFGEHPPGAFQHIPQGGGDPRQGHRCPGEPVAMSLLDRTLQQLAATTFTVSAGQTDLSRIPPVPGGGVVVVKVEPKNLTVDVR
jgi:fatty-acid peroxygenase